MNATNMDMVQDRIPDTSLGKAEFAKGASKPNAYIVAPTMKKMMIGLYILLILLGVGTGYILAGEGVGSIIRTAKPTRIDTDTVVGITDAQTFKDSAAGTIEAGGLDGEGTHKLIRVGGPTQTAYLISSVVDLDEFIGKKVTVYGQTFAGEKAAWLMDVGKIELEPE